MAARSACNTAMANARERLLHSRSTARRFIIDKYE